MKRILKQTNLPIRTNNNSNKHYAVEYTYWFLSLLGIWPIIFQSSVIRKIIALIHVLIVISIFIWEFIFRFIHMYYYVDDFDEQITLIAPISFLFVILLKYMAVIYRRNTIMKFINHINADWTMIKCQEEKKILTKNRNVCNNITFVFTVLMYLCGAFYNCIMPHVIPFLIGSSNNQNTSERMIIFPGYNVVIDVEFFPLYQITYIFHIITAFYGYTVLIATCNLTVILVTHVSSQIQIIISQLNSLLNDFSNEKKFLYAKLSLTIRRHVRVLEFSNNILKKTLFEICLIEIGASSALLCIDEFCFLRMLDKKDFANMVPYFMIFLSLSLNILILCYFSELLDSQFMEIGIQSYAIDWYKIPLRARRYLQLMINMSQRPQKISAGGIIDLSFLTYVQIIKSGFAYLQVLRASNIHKK
ncbi:odorant receptor 67a-like [Microplitis mediator]|uniref:odorant receptor 67a-like n=1 Tax=Microplitis mediator TaxID=375433 RepID=UPI00255592A2|nr:odorant receptor 67a-like [Microplitis mediator]